MSKSIRTYQRQIATLKALVGRMQWVQPTYNGSPSCACCGEQQHMLCVDHCEAAKVTGDRGTLERGDVPLV